MISFSVFLKERYMDEVLDAMAGFDSKPSKPLGLAYPKASEWIEMVRASGNPTIASALEAVLREAKNHQHYDYDPMGTPQRWWPR